MGKDDLVENEHEVLESTLRDLLLHYALHT